MVGCCRSVIGDTNAYGIKQLWLAQGECSRSVTNAGRESPPFYSGHEIRRGNVSIRELTQCQEGLLSPPPETSACIRHDQCKIPTLREVWEDRG